MRHVETYDEAAERLLDRYAWQVYATLTWRYPVGLRQAQREVFEFVCLFGQPMLARVPWQRRFGNPFPAFAYAACERGKLGGRYHIHLLIGGLNSIARSRGYHLWQWHPAYPVRGHGDVKWEPYRRHGGAGAYVMKDAQFEPETGAFIGSPRRLHERKRGRRGRGSSTIPFHDEFANWWPAKTGRLP